MPHEPVSSTAKELRNIVDRESIRDVILRVCRAMDRADLELFRRCYHEDAWDDHGYYKGPIAEFVPGSIARPAHVKNVMHMVGSIAVDLEDDAAWSESYFIAYQRSVQDGLEKDTVFGGRYIDLFERRKGEWKIAHRTVIYDWNRVDPVTQSTSIPGAVLGSASRSDPSYHRDSLIAKAAK